MTILFNVSTQPLPFQKVYVNIHIHILFFLLKHWCENVSRFYYGLTFFFFQKILLNIILLKMHKIIQTVKIHKILIFRSDLTTISCLSTPGLGRRFLNTTFISSLSKDDAQSYPSLLNRFPFIQKKMPACPTRMFMPNYQAYKQMPGIHHPED